MRHSEEKAEAPLKGIQLKKYVIKNFENFTKACNFIKKRLQLICFLVNFAKFLETPILKSIFELLLLKKM